MLRITKFFYIFLIINLLVCLFIYLNIQALTYKKLIIKNIPNAQYRALVVANIEDNNDLKDKLVIFSEELSTLSYTFLVEITADKLIEILNQNKLLVFVQQTSASNDVVVAIDTKKSNIFANQVKIDSLQNNRVANGTIFSDFGADNLNRQIYLEHESNDTPFIANLFSLGQSAKGEILNRGDIDFFKVYSSKPQTLWKVKLNTLFETTFSPVLISYDQNIDQLASYDISQNSGEKVYNIKTKNAGTSIYIKIYDKIGPKEIELGKISNYKYLLTITD